MDKLWSCVLFSGMSLDNDDINSIGPITPSSHPRKFMVRNRRTRRDLVSAVCGKHGFPTASPVALSSCQLPLSNWLIPSIPLCRTQEGKSLRSANIHPSIPTQFIPTPHPPVTSTAAALSLSSCPASACICSILSRYHCLSNSASLPPLYLSSSSTPPPSLFDKA